MTAPSAAAPPILLGTSGFSYDDWRGPFYPPGTAKSAMLEYYAQIFPALEINSTYYNTPGLATAESIVRRAAGRLTFAIKAPGAMTHQRDTGRDVVLQYRRFLEPFVASGKLAAVLLQFPAGFHEGVDAWELLEKLRRALDPLPLVAEMRHASWDSDAADARLAAWELSRALVDQPDVRGLSQSARLAGESAVPRRSGRTGPIAYVRFHGRNADAWYGATTESGRYLYKYSAEQLELWAPPLKKAARGAKTAMAFFNNHPQGNAAADARTFASILGAPLGSPAQEDLFA